MEESAKLSDRILEEMVLTDKEEMLLSILKDEPTILDNYKDWDECYNVFSRIYDRITAQERFNITGN